MKAVIHAFSRTFSELAKVEWPSFGDVVKFTLMVFVISAVVGVYVGALDLGFTKLLELVIKHW